MPIFRTQAANDNNRSARRQELIGALLEVVQPLVCHGLSFRALEEQLLEITNELVRRALKQALEALSAGLGKEVLVAGAAAKQRYRRHHRGTVRYHSLVGPLDIKRWTYRLVGKRNGPTIVPMELQAGLISGATPALAYALAQGHAKSPIRSVEEDLHAAHRHPPSRATMDRIAREIGSKVHEVVSVIEPKIRSRETLPAGAHAVNIGLDRTTVPMEEAASAAEKTDPSSLRPQIKVRYRMAYVGTVCVTDRAGNVLCAWRYAAPAHEGPKQVVSRMILDVNQALKQKSHLKLGVVQDGAPEMWNLLREALRKNDLTKNREWRETIDRYHFIERLASVLEAFYPGAHEANKRRRLLERWRQQIDRSDRAPKRIHDWLERESHRLDSGPEGKKGLWLFFDDKLGCYMIRQDQFHYASLANDGLHSGSGVTEGACKFLITSRAKRSGQRWTKKGISAVLALRSLLASERLAAFWALFAQRHRADCANAA